MGVALTFASVETFSSSVGSNMRSASGIALICSYFLLHSKYRCARLVNEYGLFSKSLPAAGFHPSKDALAPSSYHNATRWPRLVS
jgi:hypothetical protein